jgi:acyl-CoA dehydrogenase
MPNPTTARAAFAAWNQTVASAGADPHLLALLRHHGHADAVGPIEAFAAVAHGPIDALARLTNRDENLPRLRRWNGTGERVEEVEFHPSYHEIGRLAYATGAMSRYAKPGNELETLAFLYLLAQQGEAGHCCPFACTAGMIKILQADRKSWNETPGLREGRAARGHAGEGQDSGAGGWPSGWLERLLDPDYDRHFHAAQFLTEVQGGSDVGANALRAVETADGWALHGEKWFCSVADAHLWLVTARPDGAPDGTRGLMAFAVPRNLPDGTLNQFALRRLKYKLGTRSMASSEIDFEGARAWPVGDFRRVVDVVLNTSRLYNAVCSSGFMERAYQEARAYASTRMAFGKPILAFPAIARMVARLRTEAWAARGLTFALAALADRMALGQASDADSAAYRMLVNLNKYWTSHVGTANGKDAIEILGGNGAIEEFTVLPRLLRDSIVCEAWEGGHNVLCAQVLKDAQRLRLHEPMFAWLEQLGGPHPTLTEAKGKFEALLARPDAELHIRDVADMLRPVAQAAALRAVPAEDAVRDVVIEHLLTTNRRGWDPLEDRGFAQRIAALVASGAGAGA